MGKLRTTEAWAIAHWRGHVYPSTVRGLRREAVEAFKQYAGRTDSDWSLDVKSGVHRPVKVLIVPITEAGRRALQQAEGGAQ